MVITAFEGKVLRKQEGYDTAGVRHHRQTTVGVDVKFRNKLQNKHEIGAVNETETAAIFHDIKNVHQKQEAAGGNEKLNVRSYGTGESNTTTLCRACSHGNQTTVLNFTMAPRDERQIVPEKCSKAVEIGETKQTSGDKQKIVRNDRVSVRPVSDKNNHEGHYLNPCGEDDPGEIHSLQHSNEAMVNPTAKRTPPAKYSAKIPPRPPASPVNFALGSWGEGVVGTSDHVLKSRGHVTSRGLDVAVKSSADFYSDFAYVSSYAPPVPPSPKGRQTRDKPHKTENCNCRICADARRRERAAVKIQSHLRGYQVLYSRIHI